MFKKKTSSKINKLTVRETFFFSVQNPYEPVTHLLSPTIMWEALLKIQSLLQAIRPVRIQYSPAQDQFYQNHSRARKIYSTIIEPNHILIWITSWIGLKHVLSTDDEQISVQQQVLAMVCQVLYVGIFLLVLASVWTFQFRGNSVVWIMTQVGIFEAKRNQQKPGAQNKTKSFTQNLGLFDLLLYGMVGICATGASTVGFMPLLSHNTPAHIILQWILPESLSKELFNQPILLILICCTYLGIFGFFGGAAILQVFIYMCATLYEMSHMMKPTYIRKDFRMARISRFPYMKQLYMQSYLFTQQYNALGYIFFPVVMTSGFVVNVVTSMICITFYSHLSVLLVVCFAGFDVICAGLTVGIHSFAMISSEEGEKFHKLWKFRLVTKRLRKDLQACMPITVEVGPFFTLQRTTLLTTTSQIVDAIVNLLIMEK